MQTPPAPGLVPHPRPAAQRAPVPGRFIVLAIVSAAAAIHSADWMPDAAIWLLWAAWRWTRTGDGPPVLAMALTFQWVQVTAGIWYQMLTGIRLPAIDHTDYRTMVLIGLGCLAALLAGLGLGMILIRPGRSAPPEPAALGWGALIAAYLTSVAMTRTIQEFAWELPALTQGILALTYIRFAVLFLIFRRLSQPRIRPGSIAVLLAGEIVLGFTGYFAGFREPMMMAAMVLTGAFDRKKINHWLVLGALGVAMLLTGVIWMGIRTEYRRDFEDQVFARSREVRLDRISALSSKWLRRSPGEMLSDVDAFVDRLWAVYYPALALDRVPAVMPHEDGEILGRAVVHVLMPRLLFPDKPPVESDSEKVRRYTGLWVAGIEENTSIAFGYAAESYVDFGVPLMLVPVFAYGALMGMAYQGLRRVIRHPELAIASVTVIFWLSLYLFERSWANMLGLSLTLLVYLGGVTIVVDRLLRGRALTIGAPARQGLAKRGLGR
jgi:hypothetical protein